MKKNKTISYIYTATSVIISLFVISAHNCAAQAKVTSFISPRSQTINGARALAYFQHQVNNELNLKQKDNPCLQIADQEQPCNTPKPRATLYITPGPTRSFWPEHINRCLFWPECQDTRTTFVVSGSRVENRNTTDWLADYFGLPTDFKSAIITRPRVKNFQLDLNAYINCDTITEGLYLILLAPIVHTNWDMKLTESVIISGVNQYDPGYFSPNAIERSNLLNAMSEYLTGCRYIGMAPTTSEPDPVISPEIDNTIQFQPLKHAKISPCPLKKSGIAEVQITAGYHIFSTPTHGLDCFAQCNIPGGNKSKGEFLFEPIIGNGHHAEIGLGLAGYWQPWFKNDPTQKAALYAHLHINHLFSSRQVRTFDLNNKPLSRYMLAAQFRPAIAQDTLAGQSAHNNQITYANALFNNLYAPVANLTTMPVDVHIAWQTQFTLMFEYGHNHWSWFSGYNFWARSKEKITQTQKTIFDSQLWTIKGDAQLFGFSGTDATSLSATQQTNATINAGKNFGTRGIKNQMDIEKGRRNPAIDNPAPAVSASKTQTLPPTPPTILTATPNGDTLSDQINTSIQPIILSSCDIDLNSACTSGLSHIIFGQFQRTWQNKKPYIPFIALGAQVEFGPTGNRMHSGQIPQCLNCALSNWGVWAKIGFSYE